MILHRPYRGRGNGRARTVLLRKMARFVTQERGRRRWATHLYLAQPIRAGLSTVKTSTLTTGDHNRAYLRLSQARALFFSPSSRCCTKGYLPFCSSIAPWRAIADFIAKLWTDPEERRSHERKSFVRRKRERERERRGEGGGGRRAGRCSLFNKEMEREDMWQE